MVQLCLFPQQKCFINTSCFDGSLNGKKVGQTAVVTYGHSIGLENGNDRLHSNGHLKQIGGRGLKN